MTTRPSALFKWTDGGSAVEQPPASLQATGYTAGEPPAPKAFNWVLWQISNWIAYLAASEGATILQTTLDASTRLVGGGSWTWVSATRTLSWSGSASLAVPTLPLSANTLAAGSIVVPIGSVAYVQANVPLTTTGSIKSGDTTVNNVAINMSIAVGANVSGDGIADNTTVSAVDQNTLTLSAAATASNDSASLTFSTQGALAAQVSDVSALQPNVNTTVFAFGHTDYASIGVNCTQMTLRNGEKKTLNGLTGYSGMVCANAGQAFTARQALYISSGSADSRTAGQAYLADASAAFGATRAQFIGFASHDVAVGECAALVSMGTMSGFQSLSAGSVYYLDPANPGGIVASRTTTTGQYAVPVGFAIDSDSLRINPDATRNLVPVTPDVNVAGALTVGGAAKLSGSLTVAGTSTLGNVTTSSLTSGNGFRQNVEMGSFGSTSGSTVTNGTFVKISANQNGFYSINRTWQPEVAGSIMCVKLSTDTFFQNEILLTVSAQRNTTSTVTLWSASSLLLQPGDNQINGARTPTSGASYFYVAIQAAKGAKPYLAGDVITVKLTITNAPQVNGNSVLTRLICDMTVETAA